MLSTKSFIALLTFTIGALAIGPFAQATGGFVGNGADRVDATRDSAWFVQDTTPVSYCVTGGDPSSAMLVNDAMSKAIFSWQTYWVDKVANSLRPADDPALNFDFRRTPACNDSTEVVVSISEIRPQMHFDRASSAFGAVERMSYDAKTGRSVGIIWINSKIVKTPYLLPTMMQQLGKVFGCGPVEGTIMERGLVEKFFKEKVTNQKLMSRIDQRRELVLSPYSPLIFEGPAFRLSRDPALKQSPQANAAGKGTARLSVNGSILEGTIVFNFGNLKSVYTTRFDRVIYQVPISSEKAFKKVIYNEQGVERVFGETPTGISYSGRITNGHRAIPLILNRNLGKAFEILTTDTNGVTRLLETSTHAAE